MKPERYKVKSISEISKITTSTINDAVKETSPALLGLVKIPEQIKVDDLTSDLAKDLFSKLNKKVVYNPIKKLNKTLSENEIITKIGEHDDTDGSCFSLALAYISNKMGYDVRDFRGGKSQDIFASNYYNIAKMLGGEKYENYNITNAIAKIKETTQNNKEYMLKYNRHAAIIRKNNDKIEFLELQNIASENGWKALDTQEVLFKRFCSRYDRKFKSYDLNIFEVEKIYNNADLIKLLGYLNTASSREKIK